MMKKILPFVFALAIFLIAPSAYATTAGPLPGGTITDSSATGTVAWVNPNNVKLDDGVFATFTTAAGTGLTKSHYIEATNLGFSIPAGATINGIQVDVVRKANVASGASCGTTANEICDNVVSLINSSGALISTNKAATTIWPTAVATSSYGNSGDLWSATWAASDINNSNFGVAIGAKGEGFGGPSCLSAGTLILTPKGEIPIQDLKVGQKIWSYSTSTKEIELDTITSVQSEPISDDADQLYEVTTSDGNLIKATASHLFFANGEWVAAPNLKVGDKLLDARLHITRIVKIKAVADTGSLVWNISVKKNPDFFASNTLVHNSSTAVGSIDYIQITITYTAAAAGGFLNGLQWIIQWLF